MVTPSTATSPRSGIYYFAQGWQLMSLPGIRCFVIVHLLLNVLLMGSAFWWLFSRMGDWIAQLMGHVPEWLQWLSIPAMAARCHIYPVDIQLFFSTIANFIAAPFNGLLAEQLEARLTGKALPDSGVMGMVKDIPRIMRREVQKLTYYLPRAIVLLLLYLIFGIGQTMAPLLWFGFSAWMLAIQYCDYPFDNHKISFPTTREALRRHKLNNLQFGALVSVFTLVPFLNLVVTPVAVCGATALWVGRYHHLSVSAGTR